MYNASENEWIWYFDETKCIRFLIKYEELESYNWIWNKVSNLMKKWFDSEPMYKDIDFVFKMDKNYYPQVFLKV